MNTLKAGRMNIDGYMGVWMYMMGCLRLVRGCSEAGPLLGNRRLLIFFFTQYHSGNKNYLFPVERWYDTHHLVFIWSRVKILFFVQCAMCYADSVLGKHISDINNILGHNIYLFNNISPENTCGTCQNFSHVSSVFSCWLNMGNVFLQETSYSSKDILF
jgi:hypothetical protein